MIFKRQLANLILEGRKTQTRRPQKPDENVCRYKVSHTYAVQPGRGKPEMARIEILAAATQRLGELTFHDARAEGFKTTSDFFDYWTELYHQEPDLDQPVWAISFKLADTPRFLADVRAGHGDYTYNQHGAIDDCETVDGSTLGGFAKDARFHEALRRAEPWAKERQKIQDAIDALERINGGIDHRKARHEIRMLRNRLASIDRELAA